MRRLEERDNWTGGLDRAGEGLARGMAVMGENGPFRAFASRPSVQGYQKG